MARSRTDIWRFGRPAEPVAPPVVTPAPAHHSAQTCGLYLAGRCVHGHRSYADQLAEARRGDEGFVWLTFVEPTMQALSEAARTFELHPLAVEDAVHGDQRPKLEEYGDTSFLVLKTARYVEHDRLTETTEVIDTGELMLFVGACFVVSVVRGPATDLDPVRRQLETEAERLRLGPWAVVYAIADHVVDEYLAVVGRVQADIAKVEEGIFASRRSGDIQRIYKLKRELMELRRAVTPLGRPLAVLASAVPEAGAPDVPMQLRHQFRDVQDHLARVVDQLNAYDDLLSTVLAASLAEVGIRQNDDMRRISAWVAIAAVPTMIAGIYGMNFEHMPELTWTFGYPAILTVMLTICLLLYRAFRRSGWL